MSTTPTTRPDGGDRTLADAFKQYRKLRLAGKSLSTVHQYDIYLRSFDRYLERPALLTDLDDETVTAWLGWMSASPKGKAKGRSPATVNRGRECVLALWRWLARKRMVDQFPDVDKLREFKRVPEAWSAAQIAHLVETAFNGDWLLRHSGRALRVGEIPMPLWWTAILLFVYDTGCRIGAVLQVKVADCDLDTGRVLVRAESQKQHADQVFHLDPSTCAILRQFAHVDRELLFPWERCIESLYNYFIHLLKAAKLPHGRRDKFHRIRRTAATMAELHVGRGVATVLLGHSSPDVTKSYVDTSMMPENHVAERLPRPVLVGVQGADGKNPAPEALVPAPFAAPTPVEHKVAGLIVPPIMTPAMADKTLDVDPFPLLRDFLEAFKIASPRSSQRQRRNSKLIQAALVELKVRTLRDLADPEPFLRFIAQKQSDPSVARTVRPMYRTAMLTFATWLAQFRGVRGLERLIKAISGKGNGVRRLRPDSGWRKEAA